MTVLALQQNSLPIDLDLDFARVREPIVRGEIKRSATDFKVSEDLGFEPSGAGEHVYLQIRKIELNTAWVGQQLARFCGIRDFDVGFAGRKDKYAETTQWFSCYLPGKEVDWKKFALDGAEILSVTRHSKKLRKGQLAGNRFKLRIRKLEGLGDSSDKHSSTGMSLEKTLHQTLDDINQKGFPNYFGEQRFGFDGGNIEKALEYFSLYENRPTRDSAFKRLERKFRSKKDIYISAARSWLFNTWLADKVCKGQCTSIPENLGLLYGDGSDSSLYEPGLSELLCHGLETLRIKEAQRPAMICPVDLEWTLESLNNSEGVGTDKTQQMYQEQMIQKKSADSLTLVLEFYLPKGTYATSMLREFVDYTNMMTHAGNRLGPGGNNE